MTCDVVIPVTRARRAVRGGFTLIELVVVLLLVAVATAVTVPAFLAEPEQEDLDIATQRIDLLLRLARDSAVHIGMPVTVSIDSVSGTAWLVTGTHADMPGDGGRTAGSVHAAPGASLDLPPSVTMQLAGARARFRFIPGGAAFGDTILLSSGGVARAITIDPWTGDAIVY